MKAMTDEQKDWLTANPQFEPIGPPRPVTFSEWGTLTGGGTYERLDNQPRRPIQVGGGSIGVCVIASERGTK